MIEFCLNNENTIFVADKCRVLPVDDLVKLCTNFYREDEITHARTIIRNSGRRLPKRKGQDRLRHTVENIVKVVLDPSRQLPVFYAVDLARLPPVDVTHCDISALL